MQNKPVIAATNPLHYVYYRQQHSTPVIASSQGITSEYAQALGFTENVTLYNVANTPTALITTDITDDAAYIAWKPVDVTKRMLGNSYATAHNLEQKDRLRQLLPAALFPPFTTLSADELAVANYTELATQLSADELVLQISNSTGGKGTYFVHDQLSFTAVLPEIIAAGQTVVISKRIVGTSRALQCFFAEDKLYMPPWWHRDLVSIDGVCALNAPTATRYSGAILQNIPADFLQALQPLQEVITTLLSSVDYYGICGVDIVVDDTTQQIYLIELNPRFTAVSHMYATAMRAVGYKNDFMTAQVTGLVQGSVPALQEFDTSYQLPSEYYYLKLQNTSAQAVQLSSECRMGVYNAAGEWQRLGWGIDVLQGDPTEMVVIPEVARSMLRRTGERVFSVIGHGDPITEGALTSTVHTQLQKLRQQFLNP